MTSGGFIVGARHVAGGFRLLTRPGIRCFVIAPLTVNILLFALALGGLGGAFAHLLERYLSGWPVWTHWIAWLVFGVLAAVIVFFAFTLLANVIASPFNGMLAEAVERHLTRPGEPLDRKSTRLNSSHIQKSRMPSSA